MLYASHVVIIFCLYSVLALALDLLIGHLGLVSLSHAAFYGIGGYASALVSLNWGVGMELSLPFAVFAGGVAALVVGLLTLRLHSDLLVIGSLALQVMVSGILNNWSVVTRGPLGIGRIPQPISARSCPIPVFLGISLVSLVFALLIYMFVTREGLGRVLRTIRDDENLARSFGKNVFLYRNLACFLSGSLAALAGAVYAHYMTYIDPSSFTIFDSILMLAMVIVGGTQSAAGSLLGSAILVATPEVLRFLGLPIAAAGNLRAILFGMLLLFSMLFRPVGILGKHAVK